jgi:hypothetical protein
VGVNHIRGDGPRSTMNYQDRTIGQESPQES